LMIGRPGQGQYRGVNHYRCPLREGPSKIDTRC
jgi:hypothetical protein